HEREGLRKCPSPTGRGVEPPELAKRAIGGSGRGSLHTSGPPSLREVHFARPCLREGTLFFLHPGCILLCLWASPTRATSPPSGRRTAPRRMPRASPCCSTRTRAT